MRIALLDDDLAQRALSCATLEAMGHHCCTFDTGSNFLREVRRETYDLLVLAWQLPDMNAVEVVRWVREHCEDCIPVLLLARHLQEQDIVKGLASGADDVMSTPLRVGELIARVQALLRRVYPVSATHRTVWGRYHFGLSRRQLEIDGRPVTLTQKEFELAYLLFSNVGRLLSRKHLLDSVWGASNLSASDIMSRTLDTHISKMRAALGLRPESGYRLSAVYGQGYRLDEIEDEDENVTDVGDSMPSMENFVPTQPPRISGFGELSLR